jgi:hypothetical protein
LSQVNIHHCKQLLLDQGINPASTVEFNINGEIHTLSFQEIIETYMQASDEAQLVFVSALQKAMDTNKMGIQKFFEGMGQLLLMSQLSEGDITSV